MKIESKEIRVEKKEEQWVQQLRIMTKEKGALIYLQIHQDLTPFFLIYPNDTLIFQIDVKFYYND